MGTLTGDTAALVEHCIHKLPTSCRLTATHKCCACLDRRPHSTGYSTYVDGVGLVSRASRWQKYCWFCREFWDNRIASISPQIEPKDTRIPDEPDQSDFLTIWHDCHQRYHGQTSYTFWDRTRDRSGIEVPWRDVAPGHLPLSDPIGRLAITQPSIQRSQPTEHVSLDSTLDDLIEDADQETRVRIISDGGMPSRLEEAGNGNPINVTRTALHDSRQLLEENMQEVRRLLTENKRLRQGKNRELRRAQGDLRSAQSRESELRLDIAELNDQARGHRARSEQLSRECFTARHMERVFGTREEIQQQGPDYVSPLTSMFVRAYDRYAVAEEVRTEQRRLDRSISSIRNLRLDNERSTDLGHQAPMAQRVRTLDDGSDGRPPPKTEDELTTKLDCKICFQQRAEVATLPCGHLVMCSYCCDIALPAKHHDSTQPMSRSAVCPLCKKHVKKLARIYPG
ncbi:MAG: hypothetical protein M1828_004142 [Chrysothrix sp. TS-e1954]|nr:MAG: hypothetical protein M1828_004142 [Chrysothrix sp. TS-e1954]